MSSDITGSVQVSPKFDHVAHQSFVGRRQPVCLGDDLYCCQPVCEAISDAGGHFILTCKPGSHATLFEYIHGAWLGEGQAGQLAMDPGPSPACWRCQA